MFPVVFQFWPSSPEQRPFPEALFGAAPGNGLNLGVFVIPLCPHTHICIAANTVTFFFLSSTHISLHLKPQEQRSDLFV